MRFSFIYTIKIYLIPILLVTLLYPQFCFAINGNDSYLFRKIDYQQGLSNSAVLCLFQDNEGLMWFGTYDGVNCWDGKNMEVLRSDFSASKTLSNNVIHSIQQADSSCLWITTHLGVNRLSKDSRQVVGYYDFTDDYYLHSNSKGNAWVISDKGIFYYNTYHQRFMKIKSQDVSVKDMDRRSFVTDDGTFWIFPHHTGQLLQVSLDAFNRDTLSVRSNIVVTDFHSKPINNVFYQNGILCFVDVEQDLYVYDISRRSKIYIRNLSSLVQKYGKIMGILPFYEDIIIAFQTNGLVRLRTSKKYEEEIVDRNVRIYDIYREPNQNILWVASDGQGAIMYAKKYSIATNLMLSNLSPNFSRQVRSVMTDKYGGLWLGTKGDGLLHIRNYEDGMNVAATAVYSPVGKQDASSYVRWNKEFQAYSLLQSKYMDGFWVGSGNPGLFYYSFADKSLHCIEDGSTDPVIEIHDIYEENDSVLYAVTAGVGFRKLILEKKEGVIHLKSQKRYHFFYEQKEITMFYPMLAEGDSILWLGSREKGLIRFDKQTEEYKVISLKEILHKSVDDVLSLHRAKDGRMYVGTTSGLVCLDFDKKPISATYIGREQGLLNDMIHGILEDANGFLWLGTNRGLIKYNPKNISSHAYYYAAGVQVGEFSDDAYYQCPHTGRLFFGGIDGLLYLDKEVATAPEFYPNILLRKLMIGRKEVNLGDYYTDGGKALSFKGAKASFSLSFVVPDFLTGGDVEYSYMLDGFDKDWTSFSSINEASYMEIPSGSYVFKVRYKKDVFNTEYKVFSIPLYILPPWYLSTIAYVIYLLLFLSIAGYLIHLLKKYFLQKRMMQRLLTAESSGELPESASLNRELLNRFTSIYRSCDQLRAENLPYEQRLRIMEQVHETVIATLFRPGTLAVEELKLFFPTEYAITGCMCMKELSVEVLNVLEGQGVDISSVKLAIPEHFVYPVYKNALRCMLYWCYLYIAGVKSKSDIVVDVKEEEGRMLLQFSAADDTVKELYNQLSGSEEEGRRDSKETEETITTRQLLYSVQAALRQLHITLHYADREKDHLLTLAFEPAIIKETEEHGKKTVLLLEDRDEMVWLISDLLADEFVVCPVKSVQLAFEEIRRSAPALLLVDMLMYAKAESDFLEYVNKNRTQLSKTAFIPMLNWKVSSSIQRELIMWADSYIVLPYDIIFLKEAVNKAIYGTREAKQIYMEELGDWAGRIVCTTEEQADFIRKLLQVIEQNLDQEELGSTLIADRMAMSPRQFYRKFKEISNAAPSDLIKSYRMEKAARLLQNEELSIQDVITEVGISSRSYFYKEFTRRFGMTPKDYREQLR